MLEGLMTFFDGIADVIFSFLVRILFFISGQL